jgi:hypothetical protein
VKPSPTPTLTDLSEEQLMRLAIISKSIEIAAEERSKGNESADDWTAPEDEWLITKGYLELYRRKFGRHLVAD